LWASCAQPRACTLSKAACAPEIYQGWFGRAVAVDEASKAYVPLVFVAATLADWRCVVLGDFRPLAPVVAQAEPRGSTGTERRQALAAACQRSSETPPSEIV